VLQCAQQRAILLLHYVVIGSCTKLKLKRTSAGKLSRAEAWAGGDFKRPVLGQIRGSSSESTEELVLIGRQISALYRPRAFATRFLRGNSNQPFTSLQSGIDVVESIKDLVYYFALYCGHRVDGNRCRDGPADVEVSLLTVDTSPFSRLCGTRTTRGSLVIILERQETESSQAAIKRKLQ